jgi:hypothetical protein
MITKYTIRQIIFGIQVMKFQGRNEALAQISPEEHHGALKIATERARKKAGLTTGVPKCASCNELEPIDEKFLRCSNCLAVLYCSKGCQKEDWKNHKKECKKRVKHARSVF